jgi:hypothetical protein
MNWTVSDVTQTVRLTLSFSFIVYFYSSFLRYQVPLYFHAGYLLSFFVLFPFSFQSSVARSTFFSPHFFFIYSFSVSLLSSSLLCPSSCLIICLCFSIFFICVCTFISRRFLCCSFLLLFAYISSFFHTFLFLFKTTDTESRDTV